MPSFLKTWGAITGALPLVLAWWIYKLAITVSSQAGAMRTWAVFEVLGLGAVVATGLVAALLRRWVRPPTGGLAIAFYGLVLANVALTGLSIFFLTPRFAPKLVLVGLAVLMATLFIRFVRSEPETRAFMARALWLGGLALVVGLFLPAPWVIATSLHDRPHLPVSPLAAALPRRPDAPKHIVLVTFDALRARSTSLGNPNSGATPTLAALARESTVFTNMRAASDNTLVSLPTVLTGVRPSDYFPHIGNNSIYLREGFLTGIAGFLAPAGYHAYYATMLVNPLIFGLENEFTAGRMTSGMFRRNQFNTRQFLPLAPAFAWTREKLAGHWDDDADLGRNEVLATAETFQDGLRYLQNDPGPAFLWVHVAVPHTPYYDVPASAAAEPGDPARFQRVTEAQVAAASPARLREYEQIYEHYVHFGDAQLGRFLAGLRAAGLYDDTMVVVTSDHGEDFGQPGHIPHGNGIATEDISHVPLLVHLPGQHEARRVDALVGHRDLVPTVLDRVYGHVPAGLAGLPLLAGPIPTDRYLFTWAMSTKYIPALKQAQTIAAFHEQYKYLVRYPTREESLYDLRQDPEATTNLAGHFPEEVTLMRDHLRKELTP
ncbi:MAG: sulfatase [Cyanobacteria bacterium RYN_339]|nr:sulfatase [Cyanobacteria bacterium RYN_339]